MAITKIGEASGAGNAAAIGSSVKLGNIVSSGHTGRLVLGAALHQNTSTWTALWRPFSGTSASGEQAMPLIADILIAAGQQQRLAVWALHNPTPSFGADAQVRMGGSTARHACYMAYYTGVEGVGGGDATGTTDGEGTGNPKTLDVAATTIADLVLNFLGLISINAAGTTANSPTVKESAQVQNGTGTDTLIAWGRLPGGAGSEVSWNADSVNWGLASLILQGPLPTPRSQAIIIG